MQLTENSISPDSALIKIRTPKRADFDHRDVRWEGICGTEDHECSVFEYTDDTIDFCMPIELLVKIVRPDVVNIVYVDRVIDAETGLYLTEFDKAKVFAE